jgi:hypothetical protein
LKDILLNGKTNDGVDGLGETTQDVQIAAAFAPGERAVKWAGYQCHDGGHRTLRTAV